MLEVNCTGMEMNLTDCGIANTSVDCQGSDAGVICQGIVHGAIHLSVRLLCALGSKLLIGSQNCTLLT